jgi:hypothetical protein
MAAEWIVERTHHPRFPYRVRVEQGGRIVLAVRTQERWPGPGGQVFCLRERSFDEAEPLEPVERVPIAHLARVGRRLCITLDRARRKRCEFLKVERSARDGNGTIEQIFFRTELGVRAHRTSGRVELLPQEDLDIAVDVSERYPWRFPRARVVRRTLPVGDYALVVRERPVAIVERKTLPNFLSDVGQIRGLHQQLADLGAYRHAALVIEAQYADLGRPGRIGRWPAAHLLRVVGELAALHPTVPTVFAGNRKLANAWAQRFFAAVRAAGDQRMPDELREPLLRFEGAPAGGRLDARIRAAAMHDLPERFSIVDLRAAVPEADDPRLRRVLGNLRTEGRIRCQGRGPGARWSRLAAGAEPPLPPGHEASAREPDPIP